MSLSILLADDHRITRDGLRAILAAEPDFQVVKEVGTGREALVAAEALHPDVAVMDVTMPDLNGIEAARQMKARSPDTRVLVLSMHSERQFISEAMAVGVCGYLLKDCPSDELVSAIRIVAGGKAYISPEVQDIVFKSQRGEATPGPHYGANLSPREREVLQLIAEGRTTKEIARGLHLSPKTVETHRRQVMTKLDIDNVAGLTHYAIREGMTTLH